MILMRLQVTFVRIGARYVHSSSLYRARPWQKRQRKKGAKKMMRVYVHVDKEEEEEKKKGRRASGCFRR